MTPRTQPITPDKLTDTDFPPREEMIEWMSATTPLSKIFLENQNDKTLMKLYFERVISR